VVRIESDQGSVIRERSDPRRDLHSPRRLLRWDQLDLLYFGGSALWTYMATPFVFTEPGFDVQAGEPWPERGEQWRTLSVTFPADFHTHSRQQVFYVGDDGLIRRHDYTAEEFGHWAKSAHYWLDHQTFDGLVIPKQRRVFPRRPDNHALSHPSWSGSTSGPSHCPRRPPARCSTGAHDCLALAGGCRCCCRLHVYR